MSKATCQIISAYARRVIIIGDIHGCIDETIDLLESVDYRTTGEDIIVSLGDVCDRGPGSQQVYRFFMDMPEGVFYGVMGNHEDKHVRFQKKIDDGRVSNMKTTEPWLYEHKKISGVLPWFKTWPDVLYIARPVLSIGIRCVHGGFPPWNAGLYSKDLVHEEVIRCNLVNPVTNKMVRWPPKESELATAKFWPELYNDYGQDMTFFGHIVHPEVYVNEAKQLYGLDTGCVFGGKLSCAVIEPGSNNPVFHSVDAKEVYFSRNPGDPYD